MFAWSVQGTEAHVRRVVENLGLGGQVHFLGFVPRSDLVTLYRHVVASDVPGVTEQLGDAALLVPLADELLIADALLTLRRNEDLRRRLVEPGHERARAFTAAHFAKGMFEIMDEIEPVMRTWR